MNSIDPTAKNSRREFRNNPTAAELVLWQHLRSRQVKGCKFRRQHSIGIYVVDFYCSGHKLVIEVDGPIHDKPENIEYDRAREDFLQLAGCTILRFSNNEVLGNIENVIQRISEQLPS